MTMTKQLTVLALLVLVMMGVASGVEVRKVVRAVAGQSNTFAVDVEYRVALAGAHDVGVVDSLPDELRLVSGALVARVPQVSGGPDSAAAHHRLSYVAAVAEPRALFTLQNTTVHIALPPARVSVFADGPDETVLEAAMSNPATVVVHLPVPRGWLFDSHPTPVAVAVAFATILCPLTAAFLAIKKFSS
jgi:hypothetical protein